MYSEFCAIIKNNSAINKGNAFYDFIKTCYISYLTLGICRQIDKDDKSLSLLGFLESIAEDPESISKDWFVNQYKAIGDVSGKSRGKAEFEENFGSMKLPALTDEVSPFSALRAVPRHAYLVV